MRDAVSDSTATLVHTDRRASHDAIREARSRASTHAKGVTRALHTLLTLVPYKRLVPDDLAAVQRCKLLPSHGT